MVPSTGARVLGKATSRRAGVSSTGLNVGDTIFVPLDDRVDHSRPHDRQVPAQSTAHRGQSTARPDRPTRLCPVVTARPSPTTSTGRAHGNGPSSAPGNTDPLLRAGTVGDRVACGLKRAAGRTGSHDMWMILGARRVVVRLGAGGPWHCRAGRRVGPSGTPSPRPRRVGVVAGLAARARAVLARVSGLRSA
jgi:hypothetical protein